MRRWYTIIAVWALVCALPLSGWAAAARPCAMLKGAGGLEAPFAVGGALASADLGLPCHDAPMGVTATGADPVDAAAAEAGEVAGSGPHACAACAHCLLGHAAALLPSLPAAAGPAPAWSAPAAGPLTPWSSASLAGPERPPRTPH